MSYPIFWDRFACESPVSPSEVHLRDVRHLYRSTVATRRAIAAARTVRMDPASTLVLVVLGERQGTPVSISELMPLLAMSHSAMAQAIESLESNRLASVAKSEEDDRVKLASITPAGEQVLSQIVELSFARRTGN